MANISGISPWQLPDCLRTELDFPESTFFKLNGPDSHLPTPFEVRAASQGDPTHPQPPPVIFESLNLLVKYGPHVHISEAQCLWLIRRVFGNEVPVPEVYGWRIEGRQVFIYMQLIHGQVLRDQWESLSDTDKTVVCEHLRHIISSLRGLKQDPADPFIGSVCRQTLPDYVFESMPQPGPFSSIRAFNDWLAWLPQRFLPETQRYDDPFRPLLPDDGIITFTHGDLHRGNIIISSSRPPQIVAVIDWGQSGWYPEYWEYCKALYTSVYYEEWRTQWIPRFLHPHDQECEAFDQYTMSIGAV